MNILTDFEAHKRDEDFDREDAMRHRETCSPAGGCYIPYFDNVRGEQHYCDRHRPEPVCESCGDTGFVLTSVMTRHGYVDGKEPCRYCSANEDK